MDAAWLHRARAWFPNEALPLALLRVLVVAAAGTWLVFAPRGLPRPGLVAAILAALAVYSAILLALLRRESSTVLRWNLPVLGVDLAFALAVIHLTGGARSVFFLALYLIAALQSYHYGTRRGVGVAATATVLYLAVIWPTLDATRMADCVLRGGLLVLTAIGLGVIGKRERDDRQAVVALNEELRSRDRFVRDVVASLRDGVVTLDPAGRITGWSRAMEACCGIGPARALGRSLPEVVPDLAGTAAMAAIERVAAGADEGFALQRMELDSPRGRVVLDVKGSAIRGADGMRRGLVLLVENATERVALERTLRQAERLAALGTLAAGVAHEINNPIGVITARSELMLEDAARHDWPPEARADLAVIRAHAHRVARITQSLVAFARQRAPEIEPVDLNRVVQDAVGLVARPVADAGIALRVDLAGGLPPIPGDSVLLGQVVLHLVGNARDAVAGGGAITVRTEPDAARPGRVRLLVRDTGAGIPEAHVGRIFEPFFTTKPDGTGLGLAMCYGIVREHDGLITVESRPGHGSTFVVSLPGRDPGRPPGAA